MLAVPCRARLSPDEAERIPGIHDALYSDAWEFFEPERAHIPQKTFHMLAEILAISAAWAKPDELSPCMRFCVWMYLLDYFVDEQPGITDAHLSTLQQRIDLAMTGLDALEEPRFLEQSLASILNELAQSPAAPALMSTFREQIARELAASVALHRFDPAQGMASYLPLATQCVNHISCCLSLVLALGEPLTTAQGNAVMEVLQPAARAIRLANDLRTHGKDQAEGRPHALAFDWTEGQVRQEIHHSLEAFEEGLRASGLPSPTEEGLRRITRVGVEVYEITDIKLDL